MAQKVAIMTDSNSGITQEQAKELGVYVLPMPFTINDQEYLEGVNLDEKHFFELLMNNSSISTSQPSPEAVCDKWDELLKEYDEVVYIPMSSGLSGSCQTAKMLAEDYDGKVEVVNNQRISVPMRQSILDAKVLVERGLSAKEIRNALEEDKFNSSIYIMVDTLEYLKKGGRITPAVAMFGTLLNIKPVLQIQGEKLDSFAKVRKLSQAKTVMINQIEKDIINRFGGTATGKGVHMAIAYTYDRERAENFKVEVQEHFPDADIYLDSLSLCISCHTGPGALGIAAMKKSF